MHIHNELSQSPLPTSRRVGVPLPAKTRAGVSIPSQPQRTRKQVQIFDSQPLASPGRSVGRSSSGHASLSLAKLSGNVSQTGSNIHTSRTIGSMTQANFVSGSSPRKPSSDSSASVPVQGKTAQNILAVKGITAIPSRMINSPSTSSSSSSISSAMASTTAGSSSMVSTPPTSLSHSLGNAVMEFMGTGIFEADLRTKPGFSPVTHKHSEDIEREGLVIAHKTSKTQNEDVGLGYVIPTSSNASSVVSRSWKDKVFHIFLTKSTSSPSKAIKRRPVFHGPSRSHPDLSNAKCWQDPGTADLAPAVLVSAVVGADGRQDDFSKLSTVTDIRSKSTSESSSTNVTVVRPSPSSTPLPIGKKSVSVMNDIIKRVSDPSQLSLDASSSPNPKESLNPNCSGLNHCQHLSLLTQTAPSRPLPSTLSSKRTITRVSPPQQVSAHMHLPSHKPSLLCSCTDASNAHTDSGRESQSRSSGVVKHQASTSVTPTPTSPTLSVPPPTPSDSPSTTLYPIPTVADASTSPVDIVAQSNNSHMRSATQSPSHENESLLPKISIKIADLGNATPSKKHFTEEIQTRQYRAPEAILGRRDWDARVDIWSVACVVRRCKVFLIKSSHCFLIQVFELLTAEYLFDPQGQGELFSKDDDHMAQIIELLGDFSLDVKMGGKYSRELFDHSG
jgi:Protein kinase domain